MLRFFNPDIKEGLECNYLMTVRKVWSA